MAQLHSLKKDATEKEKQTKVLDIANDILRQRASLSGEENIDTFLDLARALFRLDDTKCQESLKTCFNILERNTKVVYVNVIRIFT